MIGRSKPDTVQRGAGWCEALPSKAEGRPGADGVNSKSNDNSAVRRGPI